MRERKRSKEREYPGRTDEPWMEKLKDMHSGLRHWVQQHRPVLVFFHTMYS